MNWRDTVFSVGQPDQAVLGRYNPGLRRKTGASHDPAWHNQ